MKKLYTIAILCLLSMTAFSQYTVTLKVIDNESGALTNNVDDNNETNVIVYASNVPSEGEEENTLYDNGEWWYAMYNGEDNSPNGELIKTDSAWTWQATFDVSPGEYKWNPHMKTLGWKPINELYNYSESNDLFFTVTENGDITGSTTLSLPLEYEVTLKVIDNEDGALTNKVDDNNETNVIVFASDLEDNTLYDNGEWWYAMYSGEENSPNGELVKTDGVWTWQATFNVSPGEYKWNPHMKTLGWAPINGLYNYGESNDLFFTVTEYGSITGTTTLSLPLDETSAISETDLNNIKVWSDRGTVHLENLPAQSRIKIFDLAGTLVYTENSSNNNARVDISRTGIYIVAVNHQTFKAVIQ